MRLVKSFWLFLWLVYQFPGCQPEQKNTSLYIHQGGSMGTTFSVKIVIPSTDDHFSMTPIAKSIDSLLIEINQQMSTYIPGSEISRFNQLTDTSTWFPVSEDFGKVIKEARRLYQLSNGAFDVTIGPLVNLWGFGAETTGRTVPDEQELLRRLSNIGAEKLQLNIALLQLRKKHPQLIIDLSAIAKGFAVDRVGEYLEKNDIAHYMVEIGGETRTRGQNQLEQIWRIGVTTPDHSGELQKIMRLRDLAMATSGDYHNYFEEDGVRYSHTLDPRTGKPITHKLASVTVIDSSCMTADGLATAINVLGPDAGLQLALDRDLPVMMIVRTENGFEEKTTPAFEKIFRMRE